MTVLAPDVRAILDRALALPAPAPASVPFPQGNYPGLRVSFTPAVDDTQARLLEDVCAAVSWPRLVPLPTQLTPAQREVALALCDAVVDVGEDNEGIPAQRAIRRRWLGVDPPTVLERAGSGLPLWLLLAEGRPLPSDLTVLERLDVARDVLLDAYGLRRRAADVLAGLDDAVDAAATDAAARAALLTWATTTAHDIIALFGTPGLWVERGRTNDMPEALCRLVTRVLARSGGAIDERVVSLVRFAAGALAEASLVVEAVAPALRGRAISDAAAPLFANDRIDVLVHLVRANTSDPVVDAIFDTFNDPELTRPRAPLYAALRDAVIDPAFAPYVARRLDALPQPKVLRCRVLVTPANDSGLSALKRAQIAVGAAGIQGCGTDWINDEELPFLELLAIDDKDGVHRYDGAVLMGEDGVFFAVGQTEPIAWLCQFRLDCDDPGLKDGLATALASRPKRRGA